MSFFQPVVTESSQDFQTAVDDSLPGDFVVGPYSFSKEISMKSRDVLVLFDIPSEILVSISGIAIPSSCFDYFNPLLINRHILKRVKFINRNTSTFMNSFECHNLTSKTLSSMINIVLNTSIYYPPEFNVDYKTVTASRSSQGKQICEFFSKINSPPELPTLPNLPPPIPFPMLRGGNRSEYMFSSGPNGMTYISNSQSNDIPGQFLAAINNMLLSATFEEENEPYSS